MNYSIVKNARKFFRLFLNFGPYEISKKSLKIQKKEIKNTLIQIGSLIIEETPLSALQTVSVDFFIITSFEGINLVLKHTGCSIFISSF